MAKIHLDYGHGGSDPGASGSGLVEKVLTLQIGTKVSKILRDHRVIVGHSRTDDRYLSLTERANLSNKNNVDLFVSIHINSFTNSNANGVETFSHVGSSKGAKAAKVVQDSLVSAKLFKTNRGTKTANFTVLAKTKAPAILTELGFISNKEDGIVMQTKQNEIAIAVSKGILNYFGIKYNDIPTRGDDHTTKSEGLYKVQVGAYKDKANADKQLKDLEKQGFKGYIKKE